MKNQGRYQNIIRRMGVLLAAVLLLCGLFGAAQAAEPTYNIPVVFTWSPYELSPLNPTSNEGYAVYVDLYRNGELVKTNYIHQNTGSDDRQFSTPLRDGNTGEDYDLDLVIRSRVKWKPTVTFDKVNLQWNVHFERQYSAPVTLKIAFDDMENELGLRPENLPLQLVAKHKNIEEYVSAPADTVVENEDGTYTVTWNDVQLYHAQADGDADTVTTRDWTNPSWYVRLGSEFYADDVRVQNAFYNGNTVTIPLLLDSTYFIGKVEIRDYLSSNPYLADDYKKEYESVLVEVVDPDGNPVEGSRKLVTLAKKTITSQYDVDYDTYTGVACWKLDEDAKGYAIRTVEPTVPPYFVLSKQSGTTYGTRYYRLHYYSNYGSRSYYLQFNDNKNALGLRPSYSTLTMDFSDGAVYTERVYVGYTSSSVSNQIKESYYKEYWFPRVDKDGNRITIDMSVTDFPGHYVIEQTGTSTLTLTLPTRRLTAEVKWEKERDNGKNRPNEVVLTAVDNNGKVIDAQIVSASTGWEAVFDVPVYDENGDVATYTIQQNDLQVYTTKYTSSVTDGNDPVTEAGKPETAFDDVEHYVFTNTEQEDWNYSIDLVWDTTIAEERYERYEIAQTSNSARSLTYKLTINVNAAKYKKGDLEVRLPYYMEGYANRDGTISATSAPVAIAVPKAPDYNISNAFNYYVDDHGTEDKLDDELVFVNWRDIEDSINQTIEVKHSVYPCNMLDTIPQTWQATGHGVKFEMIGGEVVKTEEEIQKSPVISYGIDTGCNMPSAKLYAYPVYTSVGGFDTPYDPEKYVYMEIWNGPKSGQNERMYYNQYGTYKMELEASEGIEFSINWLDWAFGARSGTVVDPDDPSKASYQQTFSPYASSSSQRLTLNRGFIIRIPRDKFGQEGESYTGTVKLTHSAIVEQNHENDKVDELDYNDYWTSSDEISFTWVPQKTWDYTGEIYSWDKGGGSLPSVPVTRLKLGMDLNVSEYYVRARTYGYELNPLQLDIRDDALYVVGSKEDVKMEPVRLEAGDYEMALSTTDIYWNDKDEFGNSVYYEWSKGDFIVMGQKEVGGEWFEIERIRIPEGRTSSYTFYPTKSLYTGMGYTSLRIVSPEGYEGYLSIKMCLKVTLFADAPVFQSLLVQGMDYIYLHNWAAFKLFMDDGEGNYEWINSYDYAPLPSSNRTNMADYQALFPEDYARENAYMARDWTYTSGGEVGHSSYISKSISSTTNNTIDGTVDARFAISAYESMTGVSSDILATDVYKEYVADMSWQYGVFYDLLPLGYYYDESVTPTVQGYSSSLKASVMRVETIDNYRDSNRQMVKFYLKHDGEPGKNTYTSGSNTYTAFYLYFNAKAKWEDLSLFPYGYNVVCFQEGSDDGSGTIVYGGENNLIPGSREDNGGLFTATHGTNVKETMTDLNEDGITSGIKDTLMASAYINPDFVSAYQLGLAKYVKANSGQWQTHDFADLGGEYYYKIRLTMGAGGTTQNLVLFDVLEDAVNTEAATEEIFWKGSFKSVSTRVPELQGIAPKVYYSTVEGLDSNHFTGLSDLANEEVWSLTPPADLSTVTALAFDLSKTPTGSNYVFNRAMTTEVEITMVAPEELPEAELAYNRSSYASAYKANGSAQTSEKHNIGHRVTVALRDEKDLFFTKLGEAEDGDPAGLPGAGFTLYQCEHQHTLACSDGCHTHTGVPGEAGGCWIEEAFKTAESDKNGLVSFTELPTGYYAIVETTPVNGYEPLEDMWWTFEVQATSDGFITDPVSAGTADPHVSFAGNADDGFTLLNTRVMTSIDVEKKWVGEDAATSFRPDSILLDLYRNEELYREGVTVTPDADGCWKYTFEDLYVADFEGNPYTYEVRERPVPGYVSTVNEEDGKVTVTNTCLGQLEISKLVVDGDETKPFSFTVYFTGEGTPLEGDYTVRRTAADGAVTDETVTAAADGSLTVTAAHGESVRLLGLPIGAGYVVTETAASGYSTAVTAGSAAGTIQTGTVHQVTFTNTYDASGSWTPGASKTVNGEPAGDDESFTFTLTSGAGTPAVSQEKTNNSGSIAFDPIEYGLADAGQTYTYTVQETGEDGNGYTLDDTVYTVTVKITDNGDGSLTATPSYKADGETADAIVFSNIYEATGQWTPEATKTVNGVEPREDQKFSFQLLGAGDTVIEIVENNGGSIAFSTLSYDLEDLPSSPFTYRVQECQVTEAGYTGDATVYTAFVWLEDNRDGTLKVTTLLKADGETAEAIAFANTYEATGELTLTAAKTVNGAAPREDQVYSFTLTSGEGTPELAQEKNNLLGDITFDPIRYTYADAGRTYIYYLQESTESEGDLVTDSTVYTITVEIADNGDGTLSVTKSITGGEGEAVETAAFNNTLYAPLTIRKTVTGPDTEETFPITVRLYDAQGTEVTETFSYTGDLSGQLTSGDTILLGQNQSITITDLLPGMQYTVEENPGVRYTATVGGTDSNIISGVCAEGGTEAAFDNVLKTTGISVTKEWQGGIGGDIQLVLYANGIRVEPQPVYHQDGQTYSYINLPMYDLQGQTITYSVKEKYMDGYLTIYQNIAPHTGESECVYNGGTIINREVITFRIRKEWNGLGDMAKPPITLTLYCNGTVYDREQPQPDENGWYVYRNLPKYVKGERAVYTIEEQAMSGFETYYYAIDGSRIQIGQNGGRIVNVWLPATGDRQPLGLWIGLGVLALAGLAGLLVWKRKR